MVEVGLGDFRSVAGFEFKARGDDFSEDRRKFCRGDGDSDSGLDTPLLSLLTLGVAGDVLLGVDGRVLLGVAGVALLGVSDKLDLSDSQCQFHINNAFNEKKRQDTKK